MKRKWMAGLCVSLSLVFGTVLLPASCMEVQAQEVIATVEGTVRSGTTSELLKLSTKEGDMEIKIDSGTDASACKVLLPGKKINVSVSHGSDGYLHAVKITANGQTPSASLDLSNAATVSGTLSDKTTGDVLYVNTPQGEMQIKLDATTNLSGCSVLVAEKSYNITCVRGSDAYMHALSISDGVSSGTGSGSVDTSITPAPAAAVTAATSTVSGTVSKKTKENLLYLSTREGEMQIVIDANTDSRSGYILVPDANLSVSVYHGSDAYMHAAVITGTKEAVYPAEIDTSSTSTVSGTVGGKSTGNILYLDTPQGEMELKLDGVRSIVGCKVLIKGKKLSVTCARGSDAYMHALDITSA